MATFPSITPTYGMRKNSSPKIRVSSLGDGYEFRALYGLPLTQDPKVYDLTFNVSETEADVIEGFLRSRVNDQASFTFTPPAEGFTKTGTYSQSATTVTISITSHGVGIGDILTIDYTSGSATDGTFAVASVTSDDAFTVTAASSATNSGNVSITLSGAGQFVCDSWTKTIPYNNRAIINTTFREVFEP
jgi:phage-related protein|tara:strand:+ start:566 stop:1132 length:567 start_codon:yes stop_codon:yes gene_type:complete